MQMFNLQVKKTFILESLSQQALTVNSKSVILVRKHDSRKEEVTYD